MIKIYSAKILIPVLLKVTDILIETKTFKAGISISIAWFTNIEEESISPGRYSFSSCKKPLFYNQDTGNPQKTLQNQGSLKKRINGYRIDKSV